MNTGQIVGIGIGGVGLWWLGSQLGWWGGAAPVAAPATPAGPGGIIPASTPQPTTNTGSPMAPATSTPPAQSTPAQTLTVADAAVFPYTTAVTAAQMQGIHDALVTELQGGQIPTIAGNSVLAYMLGWGGATSGTTKTVVGDTYTYDGSNWNLKAASMAGHKTSRGMSAFMPTGPRVMVHATRKNYVLKPRFQ